MLHQLVAAPRKKFTPRLQKKNTVNGSLFIYLDSAFAVAVGQYLCTDDPPFCINCALLHIGLTDGWSSTWPSGAPVTFTNWCPQEPSNTDASTIILVNTDDENRFCWDDYPNSQHAFHYVCEIGKRLFLWSWCLLLSITVSRDRGIFPRSSPI